MWVGVKMSRWSVGQIVATNREKKNKKGVFLCCLQRKIFRKRDDWEKCSTYKQWDHEDFVTLANTQKKKKNCFFVSITYQE